MPHLQQGLIDSELRVAFWWQVWQERLVFNSFYGKLRAERCHFAVENVPVLKQRGATSLGEKRHFSGRETALLWERNGTSLGEKRHFSAVSHGGKGEGYRHLFEVRGARYEVRGTRFEVRGASFFRGARYEVRGAGARCGVEVRGARYEVRGAGCEVANLRRNIGKSSMRE